MKIKKKKQEKEFDWKVPNVAAFNGLFADMRMSSSMYEVFNWNSSPDPPLTPAKHKRASLSLPPTTDIFAIDDKSDSDTRRPMIQRAASGESSSRKRKSATGRLFCCPRMSYRYIYPCLSFISTWEYTLLQSMSLSFDAVKTYPYAVRDVVEHRYRNTLPDD